MKSLAWAGALLWVIAPLTISEACWRRCPRYYFVVKPVAAADADRPKPKPPEDAVEKAIQRGIQYLRQAQNKEKGHWESIPLLATFAPDGTTCLAVLALLEAGVPAHDPAVKKALDYLRKSEPKKTYVRALQTMVFVKAGQAQDKKRIQENCDWLVTAAVYLDGRLTGWTYDSRPRGRQSDNSNTQFAVWALHEAKRAGARMDTRIWKQIAEHYQNTQNKDGGWSYQRSENFSRHTMSAAGLACLAAADLHLRAAIDCSKALAKSLDWLDKRHNQGDVLARQADWLYYNLWTTARAASINGRRHLGNSDWYERACRHFVKLQDNETGAWRGERQDRWEVVSTSLALLVLSQGRTPVLIGKLAYGTDDAWNPHRHDAYRLTEHAAKTLFKNQPMAWQIVEPRRFGVDTVEKRQSTVEELRKMGLLYLSGSNAPTFTAAEEELLKEYISQGGFLLVESAGNQAAFDIGFRALMKRLWPNGELKPLPAGHAVWKAHFGLKPAAVKLEGLTVGNRTAIIYSPKDLSVYWQNDDRDTAEGKMAFQIGTNIIAYATGKKAPEPRRISVK